MDSYVNYGLLIVQKFSPHLSLISNLDLAPNMCWCYIQTLAEVRTVHSSFGLVQQ
jgi:hypothetical protein